MKEFEIKKISDLSSDDFQLHIRELIEKGGCRIKVTALNNNRTLPQNRAMHKYFDELAEALNDAGMTQKAMFKLLKEGFDLPVTEHFTKKLWHEAMIVMVDKTSTADLERKEVSQIYQAVDQRVAELTGVHIEFPSRVQG